nr:integrase, catalytic region, zinc finger, CCHC-type, peptidase aspartic, catalytic [Tanacetum cinerariifolium]
MFKINPSQTPRVDLAPNKQSSASIKTNPINNSQRHVIVKENVSSNMATATSIGLVHTARTRRPQPKGNTRNAKVPSASKSSEVKKIVTVEDHRRNLLLSMNQKTMPSECNNIKLAIRNDKYKIVCDTCKQCLVSANHNACLTPSVNVLNSRANNLCANVPFSANQKRHRTQVWKPKQVGSKERLASKPRLSLKWSPSGRSFDQKGKLVASKGTNCPCDDKAYTSNPQEPMRKWFPNSTVFFGRLSKFVCGTARFGNEHIVAILGYGDLKWGNITITRVYFIEGLGHNLFSVGQFCDADLEVAFRRNTCFIRDLNGVDLIKGNHSINLYTINLYDMASASPICLMAHATPTKSWLWHQRLSHLNFDTINDLSKNDLVYGLPKFKYAKEHLCPSYEQGKRKEPHTQPNQFRIQSSGFIYFIWIFVVQCELQALMVNAPVIIVRTDNGTEFKNQVLKEYFDSVGITHENYTAKTPQQNGVVERINRTLVEAARTIKPDISYLYVFGALCYPKNDREDIGKLGAKCDIGFFIRYAANSVAYRVYNQRTRKITETMNVTFDELSTMAFEQNSSRPGLQSMTSGQINSELELTYAPSTITPQRPSERNLDILFEPLHNEFLGGRPAEAPRAIHAAPVVQNLQAPTAFMSFQDSSPLPTNSSNTPVSLHNDDATSQQHAQQQRNLTPSLTASAADNVSNARFEGELFVNPFGTPSTESVVSSTQYVDPSNMHTFYQSFLEPKTIKEALTDPAWIESMQEERHQFIRLDVWELIPSPDGIKPLTLKWLFKNKHDKEYTVIRNKTRLVVRGYRQEEVQNMHETLKKYGLNTFDIVGTPMDVKDKLDLDQIGTSVDATKYRSMIGALMYPTSSRPDIVHATCGCSRYQAHLTVKHLKEVKRIFCYLRGTVNMGLWYTKDSGFELTGFSYADYAGCKDTFKSTSGGAQFLGEKLVSWSSKKQDCTSLSTTKSEYVSLSACSAQIHLASSDFTTNGRVTWVKIEGKVVWVRAEEVPGWILEFVEDNEEDDECWGNFAFDYVYNAFVGNSGGILCVWDPNMFKKINSTVLDYIVMVRGDWMPTGKKLLIISVYAPQELTEKKMLWNYLTLVMLNWEGEVVIMGDFNEVRYKSKRFGTTFNKHGDDAFNLFISNAGLEEVEGFDKFIEDSWKEAPIIESNALIRMMKKLKYLKEKIRMWNKLNKKKSQKSKRSLKADLADCDAIIDKSAQKAKIKWAIEGDENSKYYHGVINKKRNQLNICGTLVEGTWIDSPSLVKISKEEIKKAVWDCRIDKSPGPDGFTFDFYRRFWALEGSGDFTVASVRKMIDDFMLLEVSSKTRWIEAVPIKVNVHAWKVKLDGLPTRLNISRRGIDIEPILCPMCGKTIESTSHIFFTCQISSEILRKISRWWDIDYMEVSFYEEWYKPSGLAQMATKGNFGEVVTTCEKSWVQASLWGFPSGAKKEWGLSPKAKVRVLHTAQLDVT